MTCNGGAPGLLQIGDTMTRRISNVLSNGVSVNSNFPNYVALSFSNNNNNNPHSKDPLRLIKSFFFLSSVKHMFVLQSTKTRSDCKFASPPPDALPPLPQTTLTVFPLGHRLMDEILISLLIMMRMLNR